MAEQFIGLTVRATMKPPRSWVIFGLVANVTASSELHLSQVSFLESPQRLEHVAVPGNEIEDIEVISALPDRPLSQRPLPPAPCTWAASPLRPRTEPTRQDTSDHTAVQPKPETFQDPAILSYAKTPTKPAISTGKPMTHEEAHLLGSVTKNWELSEGENSHELDRGIASAAPAIKDTVQAELLEEIVNGDEPSVRKSRRRGKRGRKQASEHAAESSPELAKSIAPLRKPVPSGWRQTPMLQERSKQAASGNSEHDRDPKRSNRKNRRERAMEVAARQSGWATEEATDIQDMGEFDFEGNLSMFDKKTVFNQIRNDDTTADEDRLVTQNRILRPLEPQAKNYRPSENVLGRTSNTSKDVSFESDEEPQATPKASKMNLNLSRSSTAGTMARKSSSLPSEGSTQPVRSIKSPTNRSTSRGVGVRSSVQSPSFNSSEKRAPSMRYTTSSKSCPRLPPDLLRDIEDYAVEVSKLSADVVTENAGRSIAEIALSAINPGGRRLGQGNHNSHPVIVLLLGDSRASARALVAARYLLERGVRVVASILELDASEEEHASWTLNLQIQRFNGKIMSWTETSNYLKTLDAPPELIVDALCGKSNTLEILESIDGTSSSRDKVALSMMAWANKSRASVLSIDMPAGIDPVDGTVNVFEGEPAEIRAKIIACCGAPCTGLFKAMQIRHEERYADDWRMHICDIGINTALGKLTRGKTGSKTGVTIDFGGEWMVGVEYVGSDGS